MPTEKRSSNTEQIKPLPCPLCGCNEIDVLGYADSAGTFVHCAECHVSVDVLSDMKPWNDRTPSASDGYSASDMATQAAGGYRNGIKAAAELAAAYPELAQAIRDLPLHQ
ncbi:hypothetical protein EI533_26145 [Pseudomonas donghuensis]|nr:hypothetical protein [Pseudomonas donghuensis]